MLRNTNITVKEKIIIHLFENYTKELDFEAPRELTQDGIANAINARRSYVSFAIVGLKEDGIVKEIKARVKGEERRRKIYLLTPKGFEFAKRLKDLIQQKMIFIVKNDKKIKIKTSEINNYYKKKFSMTEILKYINKNGVFKPSKSLPEIISLEKEIVKPIQKRIEKGINRDLIFGIFACYLSVLLFELIANFKNDLDSVFTFLLIVCPIYLLIIFGKIISKEIRAKISITFGTFFILFSIFIALPYKSFNWNLIYSPYYLIFGISLIIIGFEIKKFEEILIWSFGSIGIFIFIVLLCTAIILNKELKITEKFFTYIWLIFSSIISIFWLLKPKKMFKLFKNVPTFLIGSFFILIGFFLIKNEKYIESLIEFFIGLPIIYYTLRNLEFDNAEQFFMQLCFLGSLVLLEILTFLIFLFD